MKSVIRCYLRGEDQLKSVPRLYTSHTDTPGSWWRPRGTNTIEVKCPNGHVQTAITPVNPNGVTEHVCLCPIHDCGFGALLLLEDWRGWNDSRSTPTPR